MFKIKIIIFTLIIIQGITPMKSFASSSDSTFINEDSLETIHKKRRNIDTTSPKPLNQFIQDVPVTNKKFELSKSPAKAVLFSMLLPGMGQLYVESYWKVPLFLGATGGLLYQIISDNQNFNKFQSEWEEMAENDPNKFIWQRNKEFYRDRRDLFAFYFLGVYILGAVDAYVGAHLYDFSVSDDLSLGLNANAMNGIQAQLILKW